MSSQEETPRSRFWLATLAAIGALLLLNRLLHTAEHLHAFDQWVKTLGAWGPAAFVAGYAGATVLLMPCSVLTLEAGQLFGAAWGAVYVSLGSVLGTAAVLRIARLIFRARAEKAAARSPRAEALMHTASRHGWQIVFLTRLSPVLPSGLFNYIFGITRIGFGSCLLAAWAGSLPGIVLYVGAGAATPGQANGPLALAEAALFLLGLLATIAAAALLTLGAKRELTRLAPPSS